MVETQDPVRDDLENMISGLNEATVELQRLLTDEAALTLISVRDEGAGGGGGIPPVSKIFRQNGPKFEQNGQNSGNKLWRTFFF